MGRGFLHSRVQVVGSGPRGILAAPTHAVTTSANQDDSLRPGTVILDRYRIVSLLGKGGMGAVYRAEDQVLGQEVALKFLSAATASDPRSVRNLQHEVKIARQVTHNNVCRVYDIGDIDGRPFISMEYVDGEDLTLLLRRIGRLPRDKAIQIARQLCSGLQAAHSQGVLHRDLKPANVMLDGKGNVRIADFGIAAAVENTGEGESIVGTPRYMAPELFTGAQTSPRSDLYSLGLVLYELFTGQALFEAKTITDLTEQHKQPVVPPRDIVSDIDPAVEKVILQCLSKVPELRPRSALAVLAALPGGDPLAESLAAGETPSPELVAAAGGSGKLRPRTAWGLVAFVLAGLILLACWDTNVKLLYSTPLRKPGAVLADYAQGHIRALGYGIDNVRTAYGFRISRSYLEEIYLRDPSQSSWDQRLNFERPSAIDFWYRQVPAGANLVANNIKGRVTWDDPPVTIPGSIQVRLDPTAGRLLELLAKPGPDLLGMPTGNGRPTAVDAVSNNSGDGNTDWSNLFEAAGLDVGQFRRVPPRRIPDTFATERAAWEGHYPESPRLPVRIEAATVDGRPVAFHVEADIWQGNLSKPIPRKQRDYTWRYGAHILLILASIGLAWESIRNRRVDFTGAFRFGLTIFLLVVGFTVLTGHQGSDWTGLGALMIKGMMHGLAVAMNLSIYYIAIEPHVRRIWPETLISWTRLWAGGGRDPLVGHSVLVGIAIAVVVSVAWDIQWLSPMWLGQPTPGPLLTHDSTSEILVGTASAFGVSLEVAVDLARESLKIFMSLVVWRLILSPVTRSKAIAASVTILTWVLVYHPGGGEKDLVLQILGWSLAVIFAGAFVLVLIRLGLLALMVAFVTFGLLGAFPLDPVHANWFSGSTWLVLVMVLGGTFYGAVTAIGNKR